MTDDADREGVDRDGADRDGANRDGADRDGAEDERDDERSPADGEGVPPGGAGPAQNGDEPLDELADRVTGRRARGSDEGDDLFERAFEDVGPSADDEALWDDLASGQLERGVGEPAVERESETYVVDKREYCQRCQFFSAPPDARCTYEGSSILAVDDTEHFRVTGCPIVEGSEDLGDR